MRLLSLLKVEGLRFSADDRVLMNDIARSDGGSIEDGDMGHDNTIIADAHVAFDVNKGTDLDVLTDLRGGVDVGKRTDHNGIML